MFGKPGLSVVYSLPKTDSVQLVCKKCMHCMSKKLGLGKTVANKGLMAYTAHIKNIKVFVTIGLHHGP